MKNILNHNGTNQLLLTNVDAGTTRTFNSFGNNDYVYFNGPKGTGTYTNVTVAFNYQIKVLR